jgi:uncharacterized protein
MASGLQVSWCTRPFWFTSWARDVVPVRELEGSLALFDEGLELLREEECLSLLSEARIGRVGVSVHALPAVFPVNFVLHAGAIYFLTAEGTKLWAARTGTVLAFEVDDFDPQGEVGWSVLVVGRASEVTDPDERADVLAAGLQPAAPGDRHHLVRLAIELVSGRAFGFRTDEGATPG